MKVTHLYGKNIRIRQCLHHHFGRVITELIVKLPSHCSICPAISTAIGRNVFNSGLAAEELEPSGG
jgi:hypothetical protein